MKIEVTTSRLKFGADFKHWKRAFAERRVTSWVAVLGPLYFIRRGLSFDRDAAGREFDTLNHPDRPTRKLADLYRSRG